MSEKYSFINAEKANYPIVKGCHWLGVSRSAESFFASLKKELVHRTVFPTQAKARLRVRRA